MATCSLKNFSLFLSILCISHLTSAQTCGKQANGTLCAAPNCCSVNGYCGTTDAYCVVGCQSGPCHGPSPPPPPAPPSPPSPPPPPTVHVSPSPETGVGRILTRALFDELYPNRNKTFYTYDAFIVAARAFPEFGRDGSQVKRRRELAAFSAHVQQETAGMCFSLGCRNWHQVPNS